MSEKEIEAILINQEEIIEKLNQILNAKFLSAEEKGSGLVVPQDIDPLQDVKALKIVEEITERIALLPADLTLNAKIIHMTEKAYIVQRSDKLVAVIAKSHLIKEYSKNDVRQNLIFKSDRRWALDKLKWEESKF